MRCTTVEEVRAPGWRRRWYGAACSGAGRRPCWTPGSRVPACAAASAPLAVRMSATWARHGTAAQSPVMADHVAMQRGNSMLCFARLHKRAPALAPR